MRGRALLVFVSLAACSTPAPLPSLPAPPATSAAPSPLLPSATVADAGTDAPATSETNVVKLVAPDSIACTLDATDQTLRIAFDGTSRPFASVDAKGKLLFGRGPAAHGAFLEHESDTLRVHGFVPRDTLKLFAKKAVTLGGWLVPRAPTALRWYEGAESALVVEPIETLFDSRNTTVAFLEQPRGPVACTDLAFDAAKGWNATTFALHGKRGTESHVHLDPIPISRTRGERPVAELRFTYPDTAKVLVVERRGDHAFVVVEAWEPGVVFGWIPSSALVAPPGKLVGGYSTRAPILRHGSVDDRAKRRVKCAMDVPITAELGGRSAVVGSIRANAPFTHLVEERPAGVHDALLDAVHPQENARLTVSDADLGACKTQP